MIFVLMDDRRGKKEEWGRRQSVEGILYQMLGQLIFQEFKSSFRIIDIRKQ
jgi:hypothetical protein